MKDGLNPARDLIERLGGEVAVSEITGTALTAPYRWQNPKEDGGTGGRIPQGHIPALIEHARKHDIPLSYAEFFGAPAPQPQAVSQ